MGNGIMDAVKSVAIFLIVEFVVIAFALLILGAFTTPLTAVVAFCTNAGITTADLAVALFIIGTFVNLIGMFVIAARR